MTSQRGHEGIRLFELSAEEREEIKAAVGPSHMACLIRRQNMLSVVAKRRPNHRLHTGSGRSISHINYWFVYKLI